MGNLQQQKKVYLSFWDISLENFPVGKYQKRELSGEEAKELINNSIESGSLLCVSADDLNAPYKTEEKKKHDDLRRTLLRAYGIDLQFEHFTIESSDRNGGSYGSNNTIGISERQ